jgi:hypothetical protein
MNTYASVLEQMKDSPNWRHILGFADHLIYERNVSEVRIRDLLCKPQRCDKALKRTDFTSITKADNLRHLLRFKKSDDEYPKHQGARDDL